MLNIGGIPNTVLGMLEGHLVDNWDREDIWGQLARARSAEAVQETLRGLMPFGGPLVHKAMALLKLPKFELCGYNVHKWVHKELRENISSNGYPLLKAILAAFMFRYLVLAIPGAKHAETQWSEAAGFKLKYVEEPVGIYWPPRPGRARQRSAADPVYFDEGTVRTGTRSNGVPILEFRLCQYPAESEAVVTFGRPYPWRPIK